MEILNGILHVMTFSNFIYCFIGCLMGTLVGVLPGLSPSSTIAILFPITLSLDQTGSIIMLAGLYYGAMYGGSTTSILVNIPGEPSSVITCVDGFQMTRQGRAGQALWISAVGSFIAGTFGAIMVSFIGPEMAKYALKFGPPEYCGLLIFCMTTIIALSGSSILKGMITATIGFLLAIVGMDPLTGTPRLHFGFTGLTRGIEIIPVMVGLFGIGEILSSAAAGKAQIYSGKLGKMMPRGNDLKSGLWASLRGTILGFFMGLLPGINSALTSFFSYDFEKRISRRPEKFGTGVIEAVAGPESANNATAMAGFVPLFALGIPTSAGFAMILAVLMIQGLQPGPLIFVSNKDFVWTVIGSMYIGNVILVILNLPLVGLWARISLIPYKILGPVILAICMLAAYSPRNTMFDVWVALGFGILGYLFRKTGWPIIPLILGFILGDMFESALRQSLSLSGGSIWILFLRPIPAIFIVMTIITLFFSFRLLKRLPREVLMDDSES